MLCRACVLAATALLTCSSTTFQRFPDWMPPWLGPWFCSQHLHHFQLFVGYKSNIYIYTCNIIGLQISNPFSRIWFWFQTIIFWVPGRVFLLGRIFMNLLSGVDPSQGSTGFIAFNELVACTSEYGRLGYPKQYSKRYQTQYPKGYPIDDGLIPLSILP